MPFNIRNMEDEKKARMGVVECVNKKLIEPFQVLFDKEGERSHIFVILCFIMFDTPGCYVAQYKFTVLLMPNGPHKITGLLIIDIAGTSLFG